MKNVKAATRKFSTDFSQVLCDGLGNKSVALFLAQTWHVSYFLSHFFAFCDTFIARIGSPLFSYQTFTTCSKCNFYTHSNLYETKAIIQNYSNVFQISIAKSVNISLWKSRSFYCLFFFRSGLTGRLKY